MKSKKIVKMIKEVQKRAKKSINKSLSNITIENKIAYITDIITVLAFKVDLENGEYIVSGDSLARIGNINKAVPNFKAVVLDYKTDKKITFSMDKKMRLVSLSRIIKIFPHFLNIGLVDKILQNVDGEIDFRYLEHESLRPFTFYFNCDSIECMFMVMPMNYSKLGKMEIESEQFNSNEVFL